MPEHICYTKPSITDLEVAYAADAARNGWGENCYEYIHRFEKSFAEHVDVKFAVATSSCTGALHLGLAALGIGIGDEVILADTNWIATVAPVVHLGATPVFVDIVENNWCIDPARVEQAITSKTKAIIATHIYGQLCDMDALLSLGEQFGIAIIEDAAEAIGSVYKGRKAGSIGKFGVFSFHGTKTITTGEGGMFVSNDSELVDRVLTLSNHGRDKTQTKQFWPDLIGYKFKLSNIQAAIGCAQVERIEELILQKKWILDQYRSNFEALQHVSCNIDIQGSEIGGWMPTVVFSRESGVTTELLLQKFSGEHIDARVFFHPLSSLPMFKDCVTTPNAYSVSKRAINLPSFHDITTDQIERVCGLVRELNWQ